MSKKIISVILTLMLLISTSAMAAISVSAETGEYYDPQPYVASADAQQKGFNRYFFLLPNDWRNDYTQSAGIYWWSGTDSCGSLDGTSVGAKWPGYKIYQFSSQEVTMYENNDKSTGNALVTGTVWYVDVPKDVPTIIFNNAIDGGDKNWDNYDEQRNLLAYQTENINVEGIYPEDGIPGYPGPDEIETMNNMIYIVDPSLTGTSETGQKTFYGNWYFYHGGDKWDTQLDDIYGGANGEQPGEPEVAGPTNPQEPTQAPTDGNEQPTADSSKTPAPQQGATSKVSTDDQAAATTQPTTLAGNGTIATGSVSLAIVVLVIAAAATGVVIILRKKELEK